MQENPIELVERVAGLMRIPAFRHRRHRLAATLPGKRLQSPDRARLRCRLASRPRPGLRQPAQLRQRGRIQHRAGAHPGVGWGRMGSEISSFSLHGATWRYCGGGLTGFDPPPWPTGSGQAPGAAHPSVCLCDFWGSGAFQLLTPAPRTEADRCHQQRQSNAALHMKPPFPRAPTRARRRSYAGSRRCRDALSRRRPTALDADRHRAWRPDHGGMGRRTGSACLVAHPHRAAVTNAPGAWPAGSLANLPTSRPFVRFSTWTRMGG